MAFVPVGFLFKQRDGKTFRFNPFKWSKSPEDDYREDPIKVFVPQEPWDDVFRASSPMALEFACVHTGPDIVGLLKLTDKVGIDRAIKAGFEVTKMTPAKDSVL